MNCYVVDDEQYAIDTLCRCIEKVPGLILAGTSIDPVAALQALKAEPLPDVIFLDIDMPGLSGIELVSLLPAATIVVFTTAYSDYAVNAFEANAADFLLKPFTFAKFLKALERVRERLTARASLAKPGLLGSIFINPGIRGKVIQLHFAEIKYVEGLKNYVIVYTRTGGKHITYLKMNEIMDALPATQFCRVHRSFIINLNYIIAVEGNQVELVEQMKVPLGQSYKDNFLQIISSLTVKSTRKLTS